VTVYLDACCLSRLTDDQSQPRIRQESEAIEQLLAAVRRGTVQLISSEALEDEVRRNPSLERRAEAQILLSIAETRIEVDDGIVRRTRVLAGLGYGLFDALHIAVAEAANVDVMLTTDERLLKRTARKLGKPQIPVQNPVSWVKKRGI
jgi:predicted nucleic acid-binding protein